MLALPAIVDTVRCRRLYHCSVLVHGIDIVCESGGHYCPIAYQHVFRDPTG
jgi:hypothetical protein